MGTARFAGCFARVLRLDPHRDGTAAYAEQLRDGGGGCLGSNSRPLSGIQCRELFGAIATLQSTVTQNSGSAEAYDWLGWTDVKIRDMTTRLRRAKGVALIRTIPFTISGRGDYGGKADRDKSFFTRER